MVSNKILKTSIYMIISLSLAVMIASASWATEYYVTTGGSDGNSGTGPSTPWRTLSYAESKATQPGDIVYLKRGDVWDLSSAFAITHGGNSQGYITWDGGSWGTGDRAVIRTSNDRSWGNNAIVNIITCSYVNFKNIIIDGQNRQADGLIIGGNQGYSGRTQNNEHHIIIENVNILDTGNYTSYNNAFLAQPFYNDMSDILVENLYIDGCDDQGITLYPGRSDAGATPSELSNVVLRNCYVTNYGRRGAESSAGVIINNDITNVLMEYCTVIAGSEARGKGITISNNEPINGYYPKGLVLRYNIIANAPEDAVYIQDGGAVTADLYGNVVYGSQRYGIFIDGGPAGDFSGAAFKIFNNTLYHNGSYGFVTSSAQVNGSPVVELKNNIIYAVGSEIAVGDISNIITSHSNNDIFNSSGDVNAVRIGGSYYRLSAVRNWEATAQSANPQFKSLGDPPTLVTDSTGPNTDGLSLLDGSPAIDSGVDLGGSYAGSINLVTRPGGAGWDIGAYEQGGIVNVLNPPKNLRIINNSM